MNTRHPTADQKHKSAGQAIYIAACEEFGEENVRHDRPKKSAGRVMFPVLELDGRIASSLSMSDTLQHVPEVAAETVDIHSTFLDAGREWLKENRESIIVAALEREYEV